MKDPAVEYVQNVTGSSPRVGTSQARSQLTVILKEWKERDNTTIDDEVMDRIQKELENIRKVKCIFLPPVIPGLKYCRWF